jgi:protein-tyrosine phosphatase
MDTKVAVLLLGTLYGVACSWEAPQIRTVCDNSQTDTYIIKWELLPVKSGKTRILESKDPDTFEQAVQVDVRNISEGFTILPRKDKERRFFKLIFNKKYVSIVGERHIVTEKINNFRDLGGYYESKTRQVRWGKLYRSGSLYLMSNKDKAILDSLHIHTILDLRESRNPGKCRALSEIPRMETLSLRKMPIESIRNKIFAGQMMKGDVVVALQDMYAQIVEEDTVSLKKIFDLLIEEENYPLLFFCGFGKDRSGILSMLILGALNVDREQIYDDYMLSNQYIDYIHFKKSEAPSVELDAEQQEALTTMLKANEKVFNFIYDKIERDYGSIPNYLEKKLHFTPEKREKLAELLLY